MPAGVVATPPVMKFPDADSVSFQSVPRMRQVRERSRQTSDRNDTFVCPQVSFRENGAARLSIKPTVNLGVDASCSVSAVDLLEVADFIVGSSSTTQQSDVGDDPGPSRRFCNSS